MLVIEAAKQHSSLSAPPTFALPTRAGDGLGRKLQGHSRNGKQAIKERLFALNSQLRVKRVYQSVIRLLWEGRRKSVKDCLIASNQWKSFALSVAAEARG